MPQLNKGTLDGIIAKFETDVKAWKADVLSFAKKYPHDHGLQDAKALVEQNKNKEAQKALVEASETRPESGYNPGGLPFEDRRTEHGGSTEGR